MAGSAYRYTRWDGSQQGGEPDAEQLLEALANDLMHSGDLAEALRNLMRQGLPSGQGLSDLIRQLRQQRQRQLERYNLSGIVAGIREKLDEVLALERAALDAMRGLPGAGDGSAAGGGPERPAPRPTDGTEADAGTGTPGPGPAPAPPSDADGNFAQSLMGGIADRNQAFLDGLPADPAGAVRALQDYEFVSPDAQRKFEELLDALRRAMTQTFFQDVEQMVQQLSDGDIERMQQMMDALNDMLVKRIAGEEPDFDGFMQQFGDMFGPNPPRSLDELLDQMQARMAAARALMDSLPTDQYEQLSQLLQDRIGNPRLDQSMRQLMQKMNFLRPGNRSGYRFRGDEQIDLDGALDLMRGMQDIDDLQQQLERSRYSGDLDGIDPEKVRELLGDEAAESIEQMRKLTDILEQAGFIRPNGKDWELTPRGNRVLGQRALAEIYRQLKKQSLGSHATPQEGRFGDLDEDTRKWEFGDPLHLHMPRTLRNALMREGAHTPVRLHPDDFEVHRSEITTRTSTVMLVDLSWSMALRGSFVAAKKVAMALNTLITSQYPSDSFYTVGFAAYARELKPWELPMMQCAEFELGTNMQHALMIAERLLARHPTGSRQILMITDGEPTAHIHNGRAQFAYPPSPMTIAQTLKAVRQCTRRNIVINTFMLDETYFLKDFVDRMTRINGGRVFYSTPEALGEYILVDYVQNRRKHLAGR